MPKYIDLYPQTVLGVGLVNEISHLPECPWRSLNSSENIERLYAIRSSQKPIVSLFPQINADIRPQFVLAMFREKWQRLWDTYQLEYDALRPYDITEEGSETRDGSRDETATFGHTIVESGTDTGTVNNSGTDTANRQDNFFGFNSTTAVPANSNDNTATTTDTTTRNLAASRDTTHGGADTLNRDDNENIEYSRTKTGNLGFIIPQKLISAEFEVWKIEFFTRIFDDIDRLICLAIY